MWQAIFQNYVEVAMTQERLTVRKIQEILRLKWGSKLSNRAVGRACNISCSTVSEYVQRAVRAGLSWPLPEGLNDEELYRKLFPETVRSSEARKALPDWETVHREMRKRGVTLKLLWIEYHELFPEGYAYTQYCEYYRRWKGKLSPSMRVPRKGGEELEVDYAGMTIPIINPENGEITRAQIFVATLAASSYTYAEAQSSQTLPNWIGGHVRAFSFFGGLPRLIKPDNIKAGVKSPSYYEPDLNPSYQKMAEYYGVAVLPTRTRKPKDKPAVENGVQNIERWVLAPLRNQPFYSIAELNQAMRPLQTGLNDRKMEQFGKSRRELFEELDRPALLPLPKHPYEFALWKTARVNIDYHISFDEHFYSVPSRLVHQKVEIRATERMVEIFHQGIQVAIHPRSAVLGRFSTQPEHMPASHRFIAEWSPERFLHWAQEIGPITAQFVQAILSSRRHPEQAYRSCMGVLSLSRKYDLPAMETASQRMLDAKLLTYRDLKAELDALASTGSNLAEGPGTLPEVTPLPAHENIRGEPYYS
jgi:transposase